MAKIKNPLMSITAAGSIGSLLTYSTTTSSPVAKRMSAPAKRTSAAQQARRVIYLDAVTTWNALTATEKAAYSAQAEPLKITGYNLFLSQHIAPTPPAGTLWDGGATSWDGGATSWDI
jgi:hypothetical protein